MGRGTLFRNQVWVGVYLFLYLFASTIFTRIKVTNERQQKIHYQEVCTTINAVHIEVWYSGAMWWFLHYSKKKGDQPCNQSSNSCCSSFNKV